MNRVLRFAGDESRSLANFRQEVVDLIPQFGDGATAILVEAYTLASGANKVRHNATGGRVPRAFSFTPHSSVTWYQTTKPDGTFLYITTSGAVTGDLFIWL